MEKVINRIAIVLLPKEPCTTWLKVYLGEFYTTDISKVFLLDLIDDDFKAGQLPQLIEAHYERMFVEMLDGYTNRKSWPELTYENFQDWFEIKYDGLVNDLGETPLAHL